MAKEFSINDLKSLVELLHLKPSYSYLRKKGKDLIVETWQAEDNPFWKITRVLEFTKENLEGLDTTERTKFLKSMLNDAVEKENYEQAAQLRDLILEL